MNAPTQLTELKSSGHAVALQPDQRVDFFTARGFELACRIAKAFAKSDAVPAQFREMVEKKSKTGSTWVENPAALGNCIVAMEVASTVGMSIMSVMQNAHIIEGKLSWSAQFVIAAINASGRFTPLRFQTRNLGRIKAMYREKLGWNNDKRGFDFAERTVEVDNIECIAWALPKGYPEPKVTAEQMRKFPGRMLDLYKDLGLPVVESSPVSMKMAVEEGWYSKPGSKWQTEMRNQMLMYRSGAFFGRIHAPDVVMGMGRSTEEIQDMQTIDMAPDGSVTRVTMEEVARPAGGTPMAEVVEHAHAEGDAQQHPDDDTGEVEPPASAPAAAQSQTAPIESEWEPTAEEKAAIEARERREAQSAEQPARQQPATRRTRAAGPSME